MNPILYYRNILERSVRVIPEDLREDYIRILMGELEKDGVQDFGGYDSFDPRHLANEIKKGLNELIE